MPWRHHLTRIVTIEDERAALEVLVPDGSRRTQHVVGDAVRTEKVARTVTCVVGETVGFFRARVVVAVVVLVVVVTAVADASVGTW